MAAEACFSALHKIFAEKLELLNALDAAVGDGDHGSTMSRGLKAATLSDDGRRAKAFMRVSGGASGTLFGLILIAIEAHLDQGADLAEGLTTACERICDLGDVRPGDKSMVDALMPAVSALKEHGLDAAITAAANGRDATGSMIARRGRAQYVEQGGKGHIDPGAVSVVLVLETLATVSSAL